MPKNLQDNSFRATVLVSDESEFIVFDSDGRETVWKVKNKKKSRIKSKKSYSEI